MKRALTFCGSILLAAAALAQSYTTFPNLQSGNVNFTATIRANGGACASGQAIVSGSGSVSCVAVIPASEKGANSGVATLDSSGLVPVSQLPFSGLTYDGSWNANTNSPTLADGTGTSGHFYITSVGGTQNLGSGSITFAVGDWALYNGSVWQKIPSSAAVSSVFGRTGAVTATSGDYTATQVTNTPAGGISSTNVQAAINELDTEKQAAASTLTSWATITRASGFDTFAQTPSSANLRGLLTDETGTGLAYFQGGALGTPSSGTLTSATGLPWSTGLTGVPTTAAGFGITGGAKLDAYAGGNTPSAFTLGIVNSVDAATWRSAVGAPDASNVPLLNAANTFSAFQTISSTSTDFLNLEKAANTGVYLYWTRPNRQYIAGLDINNNGGTDWTLYDTTRAASVISASGSGNVTINAPSSGKTLTLTNNNVTSDALAFQGSSRLWLMGPGTGTGSDDFAWLYDSTRGAAVARVSNTGNITINAPSSGTTLALNAAAATNALTASDGTSAIGIFNNGAAGGYVGTTSATPLSLYVNSTTRAVLDVGLQVGSPAGGDKGAGTLNTAGTIYQNNVPVCLSSGANCPGGVGAAVYGVVPTGQGGSCAVDTSYNSAGISSCSDATTGHVSVLFTSAFAKKPVCVATVASLTSTAETVTITAISTTSVSFWLFVSSTGSLINGSVSFTCT